MGKKGHYSVTYAGENFKLDVQLSTYSWLEEGIYYMFSPAIDLTGYGKTEEEAKESFSITLNEFVKYTHHKDTIYEELEHLGWTVNRKKKRVAAPDMEQMYNDNEEYRSIMGKTGVKKQSTNVELALT